MDRVGVVLLTVTDQLRCATESSEYIPLDEPIEGIQARSSVLTQLQPGTMTTMTMTI